MSVVSQEEFALVKIEDFLGLRVGKILEGNTILFRSVDTGRFTFSEDLWVLFRENYEEMKMVGMFD